MRRASRPLCHAHAAASAGVRGECILEPRHRRPVDERARLEHIADLGEERLRERRVRPAEVEKGHRHVASPGMCQ